MDNYVNPLPGVPLVESPFFGELFDPADPRYRIAADLRGNGFAVIDFPDEEVDVMAARIKQDMHRYYDWDSWYAGQADMRYMDAWRINADVRRIACNAKVLDLLNYLYGRPAFPFQTLNFPVGTQQHFHTDAVHFSSLPERFMCGVWLALEDIGPEQGPLLYYPGSHKWPILTRQHIGQRYRVESGRHQSIFEPMWERLVDIHGVQPERFCPRQGQALIWATNLLHGGDAHRDLRQTRWSQVTHYYFEDCVYYTPLASNEPAGEYFGRSPIDIRTELERPSSYLGESVGQWSDPRESDHWVRFDKESYLANNPDVAASGWDAWEHYRQFGHQEKRVW